MVQSSEESATHTPNRCITDSRPSAGVRGHPAPP
jgi:hypothetical protein